jgi:hypothetical protein
MTLLMLAETSGRRASDLVGITCEYCAYCFDEGLLVRRLAREHLAAEEEAGEAQIETLRDRMKGAAA